MNGKALFLGSLLVSALGTPAWAGSTAETVAPGKTGTPLKAPASFVEETTRTYADGQVARRRIEQKVNGQHIERKVVVTHPDGRVTERTVQHDRRARTGP